MTDPDTDADLDASARLNEALLAAMVRSGRVRTPSGLAAVTGISRSTLKGYMKKGVQPHGPQMRKIAEALDLSAESLWLRWFGYEVPEPGLTRIAVEIDRLRQAIIGAGGDDSQLADAIVAIDAARADPPPGPGEVRPSEPDASSPPHRSDAGTPRQSRR